MDTTTLITTVSGPWSHRFAVLIELPIAVDPSHPVYNAIPGRYVNRIGWGNYTIGRKQYFTEQNDGNNTLHVGTNNWSFRDWDVTDVTETSITFSIHDASNSSLGLLGDVDSSVTYSVEDSTWKISMEATSPERKTRRFGEILTPAKQADTASDHVDAAYLLQP